MTTKDEAVGIPSRSQYGEIAKLKPGDIVDFIIQQHDATRAGKHYDVRFGSPETQLFSWAMRKELPGPGERRLAIQQPLHRYEYRRFEGKIPKGYGKGVVKKIRDSKIVITDVQPDKIIFTTAEERYPERFALIRNNNNKWFVVNITPAKYPEYEKPKFKQVDASAVDKFIDKMKEGDTLQEKIDGAHGLIQLLDNTVEVLSYRKSVSGRPIVHTERVFKGERPKIDIPPQLRQSLLAGEIYGAQEGKAIEPQELGGILNSVIRKAIEKQKEGGIDLRVALFDIAKLRGKSIENLPYKERMKIIREQILPLLPDDVFEVVAEASTPSSARRLWDNIRSKRHAKTKEGVILRPADGPPIKAKLSEEEEVVIRKILPGEGKYKDVAAGGFEYSLTPEGKIVGRVGTGFTDEMRRMMWQSPEEFVGRTARIKRFGKPFKSEARRMPVFLALHEGV